MKDIPGLSIGPFSREDQDPVKQLIQAGLAEHWGFIDPTLNPDLNDIETNYAAATFVEINLTALYLDLSGKHLN
jgi:hypothetical protein